MEPSVIEALLKEALALDTLFVQGEGANFQVIAVSDDFAGLSRVKQQQIIYGPLNHLIGDGSIHALTIKVFTPDAWEREKSLYPSLSN